ncbi:hypothetical protein KUCAC02_013816, partial [Chaenocephalus aceratus]
MYPVEINPLWEYVRVGHTALLPGPVRIYIDADPLQGRFAFKLNPSQETAVTLAEAKQEVNGFRDGAWLLEEKAIHSVECERAFAPQVRTLLIKRDSMAARTANGRGLDRRKQQQRHRHLDAPVEDLHFEDSPTSLCPFTWQRTKR